MNTVASRKLVLGTAQLGMSYGIANKIGKPDYSVSMAIVKEAWENGIREFDTAQAYGDSEFILGKALADLGILQKVKIISKFDPNLDYLSVSDMSEALNQSSRRLGVNCLDGMMLHREEALSLWNKGLSKILMDLVSSGQVKRIGISVYSPGKAIEALYTEGIDIIQLPTNILDRRFERAGVFRLADEKKKKIYIRSPFLQGLLLMEPSGIPEQMAHISPIIETLISLSIETGLTRQEIALGYLKQEMPAAFFVVGAESPAQIRENALALSKEIPTTMIQKIKVLFADVREEILNPVLWPKPSQKESP